MQNKIGDKFKWTEESITWYENAAQQSSYHNHIIKVIRPYLDADDNLCEIACGTGFLAKKVAPYVKSITANDLDILALQYLQEHLSSIEREQITIVFGDWKASLADVSFDTVIFSFFSVFFSDWDMLCDLAKKRIISIHHSKDAISFAKHKKRETYEEVSAFLNRKQITHTVIPLAIHFDQPFSDYEDASSYFRYYYSKRSDTSLEQFLSEKVSKSPKGLCLPKVKDLGIIIINL